MTISVGDRLPNASFLRIGDQGAEPVNLAEVTTGRKIVIFGLPGAYTGTCSTAHVPSFIRTKNDFAAKGVDEIVCVSVNDPFVMQAWGRDTGATEAGLTFLADADASFSEAIGMKKDIPAIGLYGRSQRYSMLVEDGEVKILNLETGRGTCDISGGETLLDAMETAKAPAAVR